MHYVYGDSAWDGTGTCSTTFHGEGDCYADMYELCAYNVTGTVGSTDFNTAAWQFEYCMYENTASLCADTYSDGSCNLATYSASNFGPVIENCTSYAGFTDEQIAALSDCAIDSSTGGMGALGEALLIADYEYTNSAGFTSPSWVYVGGTSYADATLYEATNYPDYESWASDVKSAICSAYGTSC